jgi:hypothetical protein
VCEMAYCTHPPLTLDTNAWDILVFSVKASTRPECLRLWSASETQSDLRDFGAILLYPFFSVMS